MQALGGGGIVPVATAEFGTTFPEEKRGLALGLVGGVYGIANIFGASAGSAVLDIFGTNNWQFIFYINLPITVFILIAGFIALRNTKVPDTSKIDFSGIFTLTIMILSLLYSLKNLDFFDFSTITNKDVLPFLILFLVLIPLFIFIEKRAEDPVMNLSYFTNKDIVLTLIISTLTGVIIMGMIFVPQFCENSMKIATGSGGYFVIILGLFAGVGAPVSGKLIDKFGFIKTLIPSLIIYAIGLILLSFFTNPALMFCGCLFMMSGYLTSTACFNSKIRNLTPQNKEGLFQGLRIFASVLIPMLIGPFIGSAICGGGAMFGVIESEEFVVSKFIFLGGFIISLFVIIPLLFMEKKHAKN